jgi:integrase
MGLGKEGDGMATEPTKITTKDGRTRYRMRAVVAYKENGDPIQKMRTFDKERDAKAWGREMDTAREKGTLADSGKLTLGKYLDQWLERCERRVQQGSLRGTTLAGYRAIMRLYIKPDTDAGRARMNVRMDRLKPSHCQEIIDAAPTAFTATRARVILRIALGEAERLGVLAANPIKRTKAPTHHAKEGSAWTDVEARAFLAVAKHDRYAPYWYLGVYTGLRPSEVFGLRWDAFDLDAGTMRIEEGRVHLFGEVYEGGPKSTKGKRTIDLPAPVVSVLRTWRATQAAEQLMLGAKWAADNLVITTSTGRPVNPRNLTRGFKRLCTKARVRPIRLYDLRHTFGSMALWRGADLKTVAAIMGHDPSMLQRVYQHIHQDAPRKAIESVAAVLDINEDAAENPSRSITRANRHDLLAASGDS